MAQNYSYCSNCTGSSQTISVDMLPVVPYTIVDGWDGGARYVRIRNADITFSIPNAITCDITFNYTVGITSIYYGGTPETNYYTYTAVITAGNTSVTLLNQPVENYVSELGIITSDNYGYDIAAQTILPDCGSQDGCTLDITNLAVTATTLLGSSDGAITVSISGATGSSYQFRINGGTLQSSPTFTGLAAGTYQVRVEEGICISQQNVTITSGAFNTSNFIVTEPKSIVASENPIIVNLSTAPFDGSSLVSKTSLTIQSGITNNYRIVFSLTSPIQYTVTFYAKGFPNKPTYFLANSLTDSQGNFIKNNNNTEIANSLAQVIENDIVLSNNYYINTTSNVVTLVAKVASSRFDITTSNVSRYNPANTVVTTGITLTVLQNGTDRFEGDILDNYSLFLEVYGSKNSIQYGTSLTSGLFDRQTELMLPYQKDNLHKFDVSEICKSFVRTPKPDYEFTGFTTITTYMQPFFFKYGEVYPLIANTNTKIKRLKSSSDYVWVCNAALDYEQANVMSGYTGTTISGYLRNVPFLTNSPNPKYASKRQRELLYFIIPKDLNQGSLSVKGDIEFWDGTTLPTQTFTVISNTGINFGGAFSINVSFDRLGLDVIESTYNKLIKRLNIALYSGAGTSRNVTAVKSYYYNLEEPTNRVGLSWLNKLGTFDSFDFAGVAEDGLNRSAKSYTVARDINFDGSLPAGFKYNSTYDTSVTKKLTVNSGWINSETFDWLEELLASNEIYIYSEDYDNYVNVTGYKYTKSSNDTLYNLELELTQTIAENNISI